MAPINQLIKHAQLRIRGKRRAQTENAQKFRHSFTTWAKSTWHSGSLI
jgi:hypothetical protein